jgi:hypothetical protein
MNKNVASQSWVVFAFDTTDGTAKTGDAAQITAKISKDHAAAGATDDVNPTEIEDGYYRFDLTQAETNANHLLLLPESSTANIQVIGVPGVIHTTPANFSAMGIESDGDLTKVNTLDGHTAQTGDAYAVVNHADYGNAKLVRSTTPANTLSVDANNKVAVPDTQKVSLGTNAPEGWINAAAVAASALNGKGDWSTHNAAAVVSALGTGSTLTACLTATGFSTHSAADVVTALGTGSTLTACLTATGFSTLTTSDIDARLSAWGKTGFALDSTTGWGGAALPTSFIASNMRGTDNAMLASSYVAPDNDGIANIYTDTQRLDGLVEDSTGDRFTAKALEQAPTGGSAPTAEAVASQVRTELTTELARIDAAISTRSTLAAAGVRTAVGMTAANLDTQLAAIATETAKIDALVPGDATNISTEGQTIISRGS